MIELFDETARLADALAKAAIPYALVGGLAYNIWVETRATEVIDLLIRAEDWERVPEILRPLGYENLSAPMNFGKTRIRRLVKIEGADALVLDFILADGPLAEGLERRITLSHNGRAFDVAPPDVIIAMKRERMSTKDRGDIEGLQRILDEGKS